MNILIKENIVQRVIDECLIEKLLWLGWVQIPIDNIILSIKLSNSYVVDFNIIHRNKNLLWLAIFMC